MVTKKLVLLIAMCASAQSCASVTEWTDWTECDCPHDIEIKTCDKQCDDKDAIATVGELRKSIQDRKEAVKDKQAFDDIVNLRNEIHRHYKEDAGEAQGLDEVMGMDQESLEKQRQQGDDQRDEKREREDDET